MALLAAAAAPATQPTPQELLEQIKQLQAKVEKLEDRPVYNQKDVDETVAKVLHDADQRSMLIDGGGLTSGYHDGKFVIQSEGGNFLLRPWLQLQARYEGNYRRDGKTNGKPEDDTESGFEIRRAKFGFEGNAYTPDFTYLFSWGTNREPQATTIGGTSTR